MAEPLFKLEGTIAVPLDSHTLGLFQGLQRAINQSRERGGLQSKVSEVSIDGDLGPKTQAAAQTISTIIQGRHPDAKLAAVVTAPITLAQNAKYVTTKFSMACGFAPDFSAEPALAKRPVTQSTALSPNGPATLPEPLPPGIHDERKIPVWVWVVGGVALLGGGVWAFTRFRSSGGFAGSADEFGYDEAIEDFIDV